MDRSLLMALLHLLFTHHLGKVVEEIGGIMWSSCRLWMVLNAKGWPFKELKTLNNTVVEADVADMSGAIHGSEIRIYWCIDCKAVIMGCNLHGSILQVLHWLIDTSMAKWELVGGKPKSSAKYLMAKTDSEDRY